jgi:[acyl-carrier-protein] S-malonyltransferase
MLGSSGCIAGDARGVGAASDDVLLRVAGVSEELFEERVALVFPGQGSQFVGMGLELAAMSPAAKRILSEADTTLGIPLTEIIFSGPAETLEDTINAQPAILAVSVAALEAMRERLAEQGKTLTPAMVAGHSLGEFTALVAAGSLTYPDALRLVRERGRLMKEAGTQRPGGMAAVLGLDDDVLAGICREASGEGVVVLANANCPGQTVISGELPALERAMELAKERGAKRVTRLGVSIASHSPLMAGASAQFAAIVARTPLREPAVPVVANVSAEPLTTVQAIQDELSRQIASPVNWTGSVRRMIDEGVTTFVEIGPGQVLTGLIKRIDRGVRAIGLGDLGVGLPTVVAR